MPLFSDFNNFKNESGPSIMYDGKREKNRSEELAEI